MTPNRPANGRPRILSAVFDVLVRSVRTNKRMVMFLCDRWSSGLGLGDVWGFLQECLRLQGQDFRLFVHEDLGCAPVLQSRGHRGGLTQREAHRQWRLLQHTTAEQYRHAWHQGEDERDDALPQLSRGAKRQTNRDRKMV